MFSVSNLVIDTIRVLSWVFEFLFLVRILMSWFFRASGSGGGGLFGRIFGIVHSLTEPILGPIRNLLLKSPIKSVMQTIDFSPIFAFALIRAVSFMLIQLAGLIPF